MRFGKYPKEIIGLVALIVAALLWGIEFVVEKDLLAYYGPNWANSIRFFISSILLLYIFRAKVVLSGKKDWKKGMVSGIAMGFGYSFQTMGLKHISAGVNAFISSGYIVLIPIILWGMNKKAPTKWVIISTFVALMGVVSLSSSETEVFFWGLGIGELFTLIGACFYALGIVLSEKHAQEMDVNLLASIQCTGTFIVSIFMAALLEATPDYVDGVIIVEFIYLILLASMGTQILFAFGMKYVSSNKAGIIFLLESVSAMILGWVFLDEEILFTQILGGVLIIASILISYQDRPSQKTATNI